MKKNLILLVVTSLFIMTSCSKDATLNKKIDGEWIVESIDGTTFLSGMSIVFKFEKDKQGKGAFTITETYDGSTDTQIGNYILVDDQYIYLRTATESYALVFKIQEYSKTELKLFVEDDSDLWVLKKK
ncbi:MAG: hypothetical protein IT222_00040 [Crocinitomix sp.]|nr:hypothetical protein [Crocinitomix sp.]